MSEIKTNPHPGLTGLHMAVTEIEQMIEGALDFSSGPGELQTLTAALVRLKELYADVLAGMFPVEKGGLKEVINNSDRYQHIVKNMIIHAKPGSSFIVGIIIPKHYKIRVEGLDSCIDRLMGVDAMDNAMALVEKLSKPEKCELCGFPEGGGWSHNYNGEGDCIPF